MIVKKRYAFVKAYVDRHGKARHYLRRAGYKTIALAGMPGSKEFDAVYQAALDNAAAAKPIGEKSRSLPGSVSASIAAYYQAHEWRVSQEEGGFADGTKRMRRSSLERFRQKAGHLPLKKLKAEHVDVYLDDRAKEAGPHAARSDLKSLRAWLQHAGHDVTQGLKRSAESKSHDRWTEEEIAQFEKRHPVGSKARLCFAFGKYTGQRNSDIAAAGPKHIRDGWWTVSTRRTGGQKKTGNTPVIPLHPELRAILDATPTIGMKTFLVTEQGREFSQNSLSEIFREWCRQAGLPDRL